MHLFRRFCALFRREKLDAEMDDELRFHLEEQTRRNVASGMSIHDAALAARKQFGWRERIREEARDARGWRWIDALGCDLRTALRALRRAPGLSAVVVFSLVIGIAANTVVFSWIQEVFLAPLAGVANSGDLLLVEPRDQHGRYLHSSSWPDYVDVRARQRSFREVAATQVTPVSVANARGEIQRIWAECVSDNFFALLRLAPAHGRFFSAEEAGPGGGAPVAVISHDLWRARFNGRADVLGQTLRLRHPELTVTIVGVAPEDFQGSVVGVKLDLWMPLTGFHAPSSGVFTNRVIRPLFVLADLQTGVSAAAAETELRAIYDQLASAYPQSNAGMSAELMPVWRKLNSVQPLLLRTLSTMQVIVFLVLLLVCGNTANLLLARATARQREIATRLALGAGRVRIARQLLIESCLLALAGAAGGLLLSVLGMDALGRIPMPASIPIKTATHLDASELLFASALGLFCGGVFGLAPALQLARTDLIGALKLGGQGVGAAPRHRLRDALVAAEVALAVVVLVLAGLFLQSFRHARAADLGFAREDLLVGSIDRPLDSAAAVTFASKLLPRLQAVPGVTDAALSTFVPLDFVAMPRRPYHVEGEPADVGQPTRVYWAAVAPGYFAAMGIPLLEGRDFTSLSAAAPGGREIVVNQELAQQHWADRSPLGQRVIIGGEPHLIIGVARNSKLRSASESPAPMAYLSLHSRFSHGYLTLHVRAPGALQTMAGPLAAAVREIDPELTLLDIRTMSEHIENSMFLLRIPTRLFSILGPLALLLAAIGIYSLLAYAVARRTHEIGVRRTLGASSRSIVSMIVWQSLRSVLVGLALGLPAAFAINVYIRPMLVDVTTGDPAIFASIGALVIGVALLACLLPARRAAKIDPMAALRAE